MRLRAELELTGKTSTGFEVADSAVASLGGGGHPKVVVTVNGYTFRTSIARMGGRHLLGVSSERRQAAGISAGDILEIDVILDTAPREIELPEDLATALASDSLAQTYWDSLSYSKQSWHVMQVTGAKKAETRAARIEKSVAMLRDGRAR